MPKLADQGAPPLDTTDPRYHDLMLAGLKSALAMPWAVQKSALDVYYGLTGKHGVAEPQVDSIIQGINDWAYKGVQPPQNVTEQAVGAAPLVLSAPGVAAKVLGAVPIAAGVAAQNWDKIKAATAQAGAAEAGAPYVAPSPSSTRSQGASAPSSNIAPSSNGSSSPYTIEPVQSAPSIDIGSAYSSVRGHPSVIPSTVPAARSVDSPYSIEPVQASPPSDFSLLPVNIKSFARALISPGSTPRREDFADSDIAAIRSAIAPQLAAGKTSGVIGYGDYSKDKKIATDVNEGVGSIIGKSFNDPAFRMESTIGMAKWRLDDNGHLIISDHYTFDANNKVKGEELAKHGGVTGTLLSSLATGGPMGLLNAIGNLRVGTEDDRKRSAYEIDLGAANPAIPTSTPVGVQSPYSIEQIIDPTVKPADVTRTDEQTGKAPYDDSSNYAKRVEYALWGVLSLGAVAAGAGVIRLARSGPVAAGDVAGTVQPSGTPRGPSTPVIDHDASMLGQRGPVTGAWGVTGTQLIDNKIPIRSALEMGLPGPAKDDLIARLNTLSNHSVDGMTNDFYKSGRLPGSSIKVDVPLAEIAGQVTALPAEKQAAFNDLAALGTRIDQSVADGYKPWAAGSPSAMSYSDMVAKRAQLMVAHPEVVPLVDQYNSLFRQIPKYAEQMGAIDSATRAKLETANPNFAPQHQEYADSFWQSMFGRGADAGSNRASTSFLDFEKRMDLATESLHPGEAGRALQSAADYFDGLFKATLLNRYRSDFADFSRGQPWMKILTKEPPENVNAIPYYTQGKKQWMQVDDLMLHSALMWRPRTAMPVIPFINRVVAQTYTGSLNPLFLPKTMAFDTLMAPLMLPKGTDIGPLSAAMKALGVPRGLSSFDPTNVFVAPSGGFRKLWSDVSYNAWQGFREGLRNNSPLVRAIGPRNVETLSQMMRDAYERSTASLSERYGAMGGDRYQVLDNSKSTAEILSNMPGFRGVRSTFANLPGLNIYNAVTDALRDGTRLQFMATNIERVPVIRQYRFQWGLGSSLKTFDLPVLAWEPKGDIQGVASQTRRLMGDTSEVGGDVTTRLGRLNQQAWSGIMYGNQSLQVTAQIVRAFKDHPVRFVSTLGAMGYAGYHAWTYALSQPAVKAQLDGMTPEQRSRVIPIAFNDKLYGFIGVYPEARPFFGAMLHGMLGLNGQLPKGEFEGMGDVGHVFSQSTKTDYIPNMTGPLPYAAALMGQRLESNSLTPIAAQKSEVDNANDPDYAGSLTAYLNNSLESLGGTVIQAGLNGYQGMWAAHLHNLGIKDPQHYISPSKAAAEGFFGPMQESKQTGPFNAVWGVGTKAGVSNLTYEKVQREVVPALLAIAKQGADTVKTGGTRLLSGTATPQGVAGTIPDQSGGAMGPIYVAAGQLSKQLTPLQTQYHLLSNEEAQLRSNPIYADPHYKMTIGNQLVRQKTELNSQMLDAIRAKEAEVSRVLGHPFSFAQWQDSVR